VFLTPAEMQKRKRKELAQMRVEFGFFQRVYALTWSTEDAPAAQVGSDLKSLDKGGKKGKNKATSRAAVTDHLADSEQSKHAAALVAMQLRLTAMLYDLVDRFHVYRYVQA